MGISRNRNPLVWQIRLKPLQLLVYSSLEARGLVGWGNCLFIVPSKNNGGIESRGAIARQKIVARESKHMSCCSLAFPEMVTLIRRINSQPANCIPHRIHSFSDVGKWRRRSLSRSGASSWSRRWSVKPHLLSVVLFSEAGCSVAIGCNRGR